MQTQAKDNLTAALESAAATVRCLRQTLSDATPLEALILLPLIERAARLQADISALIEAAAAS